MSLTIIKFLLFTHLNPFVGFYTSNNNSYPYNSGEYLESLQLKSDSSFIYTEKLGSFIKSKTEGRWSVVGDSLLLKSNDLYKSKMEVVESFNDNIEKGYAKISLQNFDKSIAVYHLEILKGKNTIEVRDIFNRSVFIKKRKIDKIIVISPSLEFPAYKVVNKEMNDFVFNLVPNRVFINEKWLLRNGKIFPKKFNGDPAKYYLKKQ
jgi:hypothetical protein